MPDSRVLIRLNAEREVRQGEGREGEKKRGRE